MKLESRNLLTSDLISHFQLLLHQDREAWSAAIHGVAKSWTRLRDWTELNVSGWRPPPALTKASKRNGTRKHSGKWFHWKSWKTQNWNIIKQLTWHKHREYVHQMSGWFGLWKATTFIHTTTIMGGGRRNLQIQSKQNYTSTFSQVKHPTKTKHRESASSRGFFFPLNKGFTFCSSCGPSFGSLVPVLVQCIPKEFQWVGNCYLKAKKNHGAFFFFF